MNRQAFDDLTLDDDEAAPVDVEESKRADSEDEEV